VPTSHADVLRAIPEKHAAPDPSTLATLPKGGVNLSYMGHAEVTLALIDVDPCWTWEPLHVNEEGPVILERGNRLVMWGKLTVAGKSIIAVGTCEARKGDPEKELIGDLLRNGAMRFGIGTKLWSKATTADPAGREDAPPPVTYSIAATVAYQRVREAMKVPECAAALRQFGTDNGRKPFTPEAFDADHDWLDKVVELLNGWDRADRLDAAHTAQGQQ